jgi:predicted ATPase
MLVRGGPGTGKTSLIAQQTLGRWTTDDGNGGYFCSGAFDARRSRPEPYSAFVSAVSSLAAQALARGEQEAARIRRALTDAMGRDAARSLVEMVPSVGALMEDEQSLVSSHGACVGSTGTAAAGTSSSGDAEDASFALSAGVAVGDGGCGDLSRHLGPGGNPSGGAAAAASRFKKAVRMFLRAATAPDRPLVLLLDDLQWADEASLDLLQWLVFDGDNSSSTANSGTQQVGGFLIVGTLQADAVHGDTDRGYGADREVRMLLQLQQEDRANVTVLDLENLTRAEVERLLAAHLRTSLDSCEHEGGDDDGTLSSPRPIQGLASLLLESTRGNPLLLRETLVHLRDSGLFSRRSGGSSWEWDLEEIRVEIAAALPRGAMFQRKIQSLPPSAREMIKTASCLGGGAVLNDDVLRRVSPSESLASDVQAAARCGLLCRIPSSSGGGYAFAHEEAKQAIYQLIPRDERGTLHSRIGRCLWSSLEPGEVERYMFDVIGQFMLGDGRYESLRERKEIAVLFLGASLRALTVSSYDSAHSFLSRGIACLGDQRWRESYTLTLNLCNVSAEVAYCQGDFSKVECLAEDVIKHARVIDDTFRSQLTRIYALGGGNRMQDAIGVGFDLLKTLGIVTLPANPPWVYTWWQLTSLRRRLKKKYSFESIMRLPDMKNARALATAQVLNLILLYATTVRYELAPLIGVLLVRLTLEHGMCPVSCLGFVSYAMTLCG